MYQSDVIKEREETGHPSRGDTCIKARGHATWCRRDVHLIQYDVGRREGILWFIKVYQTKDFASKVVGNIDTLCPRKYLYVACCRYIFTLTSPYKNIPYLLFVSIILRYL